MNRLADSLSPYLLQHKDNPVDWFPWCEEAFQLAQDRGRPVFLSVGYAACHWCHVMERESFENTQTADYLNQHFVSIKVDREERPDIDQIYMNAVQVMTGRGGWPMSVFLDHDRRPFYAGTYWPPAPRFGMPGFLQVLEALTDAWDQRRQEVVKHSAEITTALEQLAAGTSPSATTAGTVPDPAVIDAATDQLLRVLDRQYGGFGGAPKFPHVTDLTLLMTRSLTGDRPELGEAAFLTLDRMSAGGIRDHVGGGFARYSVDARWLVPHFEKMLYDNALLAEAYIRGFQASGRRDFADVAIETLDYLLREMRDDGGGFHCSEDADSEGVEGKFYVWNPAAVHDVLGPSRGDRFCQIYDITPDGNFEGQSIPNLPQPISHWAEQLGLDPHELAEQLRTDRQTLRAARDQRVHPGRDDKVISGWNALAIRALAVAGGTLDRTGYIEAAGQVAEFVLQRMSRGDGRLLHVYRAGQAQQDAFVDDYANMIEALIALFEVSGEPHWIEQALRLADLMIAHFYDSGGGGFFYTADNSEPLLTRNKDWHDGSLVSGNAAAVSGLLKLSSLCDRDDFRAIVEHTFATAEEILTRQSAACGALLTALDWYHQETQQLVISVADRENLAANRSHVFSHYRPATIVSWVIAAADRSEQIVAVNRGREPLGDKLTLYRCQHFQCEQPISEDQAITWLRNDNS